MNKKILFLASILLSLFLFSPNALAANDYLGQGHWAEDSIVRCDHLGLLAGMTESTANLDLKLPRGEMFRLMDNVMQYEQQSSNSYYDLSASNPQYDVILRLTQAGVLTGYENGRVQADSPISREEAVVLFARMFQVAPDASAISSFDDANTIGEWAKPLVGGMKRAGFIQGWRNEFHPKENIELGEVTTILDNMLAELINHSGSYDNNTGHGYTVVNTSGVTLSEMQIDGDLLIAPGVGEGDVELENVDVAGSIFVMGGGKNSLHVGSGTSATNLYVYKDGDPVHLDLADNTNINVIHVNDNSAEVIVEGKATELVLGKDTKATLRDADFSNIYLKGEESTLNLDRDSSARHIYLDEDNLSSTINGSVDYIEIKGDRVEIQGSGEIDRVTVEDGEDVTVDVEDTYIEVSRHAGDVQAGDETLEPGENGTVGTYSNNRHSGTEYPDISVTGYNFYKQSPNDLKIDLYYGTRNRAASGIHSVTHNGHTLDRNDDYRVSGHTLTIYEEYLQRLSIGKSTLTVTFDNDNRTEVDLAIYVSSTVSYPVTFRTADLTANGIRLQAKTDRASYSPGETVTVTITLSLNPAVASSGTQEISLTTTRPLTPATAYEKYVTAGQALATPLTYSYSFVMPSQAVNDLVLTSSLTSTAPVITGEPHLTPNQSGVTQFNLNTADIPTGTPFTVEGLPPGVQQLTTATTGTLTTVELTSSADTPYAPPTALSVNIAGLTVGGVTLTMDEQTLDKSITIGTPAPQAGQAAAPGENSCPNGAAGPEVSWDNGPNTWEFSGTFAHNLQYRSRYVYTAQSGYLFPEIGQDEIRVSQGGNVKSVTLSGDKKTLTVIVEWPATEDNLESQAELAKIHFDDPQVLPTDTANTKDGINQALLQIAQAQVDANYTVSIVSKSSYYNEQTGYWHGAFRVTQNDDNTNEAQDAQNRRFALTIPSSKPAVPSIAISISPQGEISGDNPQAGGTLKYAIAATSQAAKTSSWTTQTTEAQATNALGLTFGAKPQLDSTGVDNGKYLIVLEIKDGAVAAYGEALIGQAGQEPSPQSGGWY